MFAVLSWGKSPAKVNGRLVVDEADVGRLLNLQGRQNATNMKETFGRLIERNKFAFT